MAAQELRQRDPARYADDAEDRLQRIGHRRAGVTVSVPARAAVSVFDMNAFARGLAGGGNSGFALSIYTKISIRRGARGVEGPAARNQHRILFEHCVSTWATACGDVGPFELEVLESPPAHIGLASSAAFQAAVYAGLNWLGGLPCPESSLLRLLYATYKEVEEGQLVDGFTTGLSGFLNFYGGFVALDTDLKPLRHFVLPAWHFAVVVPQGWGRSTFGDEEAALLMGEGKRLDGRDRERKRKLILEVLLPALEGASLADFGRGVRDIQHLGNKGCQILRHGARMQETLESLWESGIECVLMSSLGPGIVLLSARPLLAFMPLLQRLALNMASSGLIDNVGVVVSSVVNRDQHPVRECRGAARERSPLGD